jgi:hypothetical protein
MSDQSRAPIYIRVLIVRQGGQWLAQCLEHDLAAQAPSEKKAIGSFIRIVKARLHRDYRAGRQPFEGLPPAPAHFLDAWNRLIGDDETLMTKTVSLPDDDNIPDAYVISQIAKNNGENGVTQ